MPHSSRFPQRDASWRTGGPSVHAPGDGLEGAYSAILHTVPSGGTCKVIVPALSLTQQRGAFCSHAFTGSVGDIVLVMFDENKEPWVVSPSSANATSLNGVTLPLTAAAWLAPTLLNSWVWAGAGFDQVGYLKDPLGVVRIKGVVSGGTSATAVFTLPVGYRPGGYAKFANTDTNLAVATVRISASGDVVVYATTPSFVGLSASFLAEN